MERRDFTRVVFTTRAIVKSSGGTQHGEIRNLSLNGVLLVVATDAAVPQDSEVELEILLPRGDSEVSYTVSGLAVRVEERSIAIQFLMQDMSVDALNELRYIVSYNTGNQEAVQDQYERCLERLAEESQ